MPLEPFVLPTTIAIITVSIFAVAVIVALLHEHLK